MVARLILAAAALWPGALLAHPHVFVEAQVDVVLTPEGEVAGVRLAWTYDDFFTFLLTSELGLDPEGDMVLTAEEMQALSDFVLDWPADFGGDLHVSQGGAGLDLGPRAEARVTFEQGRVTEHHYRPLAHPVSATMPVTVQVYDPYYYVAYQIVGDIVLSGGPAACDHSYQPADLNAAYSLVDELLYGRPASDVGPDEYFPEVGYAFADTVTVTCAG